MSYRNELIERARAYEAQHAEPAVLDYLQLRNRACLQAWQNRRAQHLLSAQRQPPAPVAIPPAA